MAKREVGPTLAAKLLAIEEWVDAIRRTDTNAADAAAAEGLAACTGDADPFHALFVHLRHVAGRLWIRDKMTGGAVQCSFCGIHSEVCEGQVIAGPNLFICSACVEKAGASRPAAQELAVSGTCEFCNNRHADVYRSGTAIICRDCLGVCVDIIQDSQASPSWE